MLSKQVFSSHHQKCTVVFIYCHPGLGMQTFSYTAGSYTGIPRAALCFSVWALELKLTVFLICFLAESVINKSPKSSAQIPAPAKPGGSLKVVRGVNCLTHFSSLQQSRYKLFKRNALKSLPSRGFLQIHTHEKKVTELILTHEETAFFSTTMLPKYVAFYISTVSPLERRRKDCNDRKDIKGTEYQWTSMLRQKWVKDVLEILSWYQKMTETTRKVAPEELRCDLSIYIFLVV